LGTLRKKEKKMTVSPFHLERGGKGRGARANVRAEGKAARRWLRQGKEGEFTSLD